MSLFITDAANYVLPVKLNLFFLCC